MRKESMLDAIIISDSGDDTYSASSPLRLQIDGKVALIQYIKNYVENDGRIMAPVAGENENNWHTAPKLNGIRLLSYLQNQGFTAALIDSYFNERDHFIHLLRERPKAVIISTTFISNKDALVHLAKDIKGLDPDVFLIAGGPFVFTSYLLSDRLYDKNYDTESPKNDYLFLDVQDEPDIDLYIIDQRGENLLAEVLNCIKKDASLSNIPNTAYLNKHNQYVFSSRTVFAPTGISVDWEKLPERIFQTKVANIQASTGCPYNCEFCNFVKDKNHTFLKPLDQLVKELKQVARKGIKYIRFVDDNFRLGKSDLNTVCQRFIAENLDLKWMSFIRASTLSQTNFQLLKQSGCIEVQMGIESANPQILEGMNKKADPEMYKQVIKELLDIGINCSCCFIVGFPGETAETFADTMAFIQNIPEKNQKGEFYWSIYPFMLLPLSPIYEAEKKEQYNLKGYLNHWRHATMSSDTAHKYIKTAFQSIEAPTPIYSGDNMEMLNALSVDQRKKFLNLRHAWAKEALTNGIEKSRLIKDFAKFFQHWHSS